MPSRAELNLRAGAVNVDQTTYPNDSKLEQAVIYAEKAVTTAIDAVTIVPLASDVAKISGGADV